MIDSVGLLFPSIPALIAREADGYLLADGTGMRSVIRGSICRDIDESLRTGMAAPRLQRFASAHVALGSLSHWLTTSAVPLTREAAVRLDGFDTLFVELLGRCNERCVHCYADSAPTVTDALDRDVVFAVIAQAAAIGFRRIQFTGGDPLLCEFLPEAVAHAAARGVPSIEIFTNGLALDDALLDELAPQAPSFAFSVYSVDSEAHDRMTRTPGSHRRTLAAIDRVVARGLVCRAAAVLLEPDGDAEALVQLLRNRGVGHVSWSQVFAVGRGSEVRSMQAAGASLERAPAGQGGGHSAPGQRSGSGKLCITYTGDVVPCIFQRQSILGNVTRGRPLLDIIANGEGLPQRRVGLPVMDDVKQRLQCSSCRLTDLALNWLGGALASAT